MKEREFDEDHAISRIMSAMLEKFETYWAKVNFLMAIVASWILGNEIKISCVYYNIYV